MRAEQQCPARATPGQVAVYVYLQPLVVALLMWLQFGLPGEPRAAVAGVLILAGVTLVALRRPLALRAPRP